MHAILTATRPRVILTELGRLTAGSALTSQTPTDPATNRLTGAGYDANGNMTSWGAPQGTMYASYDVENRLKESTLGALTGSSHIYTAANQRVDWGTAARLYGLGGEVLGEYRSTGDTAKLWFAGRLVKTGVNATVTDRLGSAVRVSATQSVDYCPYGEVKSGNAANAGFATYSRGESGLDYAMNRYYASSMGRFTTADPYRASGVRRSPQSWNRYTYVHGDPVNYFDRRGLFEQTAGCGTSGTEYCIAADDFTPSLAFAGFLGYDEEGGAIFSALPTGLVGTPNNTNEATAETSPADDAQKAAYALSCNSDAREAKKKAWAKSANGTTKLEGGFRLDRVVDSYSIVEGLTPMSKTSSL